MRKENIQIVIDIEAQQGVKAYQGMLDQSKKLNNEMRRLKRNGKENSDEFKKLAKEADKVNKKLAEMGGAGANMAQLITRSRELNRQLKRLVPGTQKFIDVTKELKGVNQRLKDIRDQTKAVGNAMDEVRILGIKMPDGIAKGINGISTAFKALFVLEIISWFVDLFKIIDETTAQFVKLRGSIQAFTGATGQELDDYTVRLAAISQTFQQEQEEVLKAANALTKQLTGDFSESLELIEKGFLANTKNSDELLDSIKEYAPFFREAGLSGEQMIAVISQSIDEGVFSDKGVDLIKEFTLRVREMPKATKDALNAIGLDSKKVAKEIDENGIGGAFTLVQSKLQGLEDDAPAVGQALADIFGGPGEDAGIQFIKNLDLTNEAMTGLIDTGNEYTRQMINQLEANEELAEAQNRVSKGFSDSSASLAIYVTKVKTFLYNVAGTVLKFFEQLPATVKGVQAGFTVVFENIKDFFERTVLSIQIAYKKITKLNPFGKTSEQIEQEIAILRGKRDELAEEGKSVAEAYKEAMLSELGDIEHRKKVAEALTPPLEGADITKGARAAAKKVVAAYDEELAKLKAERAKQPGAVATIGTLAPAEQVNSTGQGEGDVSSDLELLKNKFLQALITEQEYEDRRFEMQQAAYERRLEFLAQAHGEESAAFIALENQKLEAQRSYEDQRLELSKRTEDVKNQLQQEGLSALSSVVQGTIDLIQGEEGERKKNSLALKAFALGKIAIDTQEAIIAIRKNAEANPGNILFPGLGNLISNLKIAGVLIQSAGAANKIRKQGFYDGGYTGRKGLFKDNMGRDVVGGVHKDEWVAPAWMTRDPQAGAMIGMLENMRKRGFQEGGFANPVPGAAATPSAGGTADLEFLKEGFSQLAESQNKMAEVIAKKKFSVPTGQIRDALDEDYRLDEKTSF